MNITMNIYELVGLIFVISFVGIGVYIIAKCLYYMISGESTRLSRKELIDDLKDVQDLMNDTIRHQRKQLVDIRIQLTRSEALFEAELAAIRDLKAEVLSREAELIDIENSEIMNNTTTVKGKNNHEGV